VILARSCAKTTLALRHDTLVEASLKSEAALFGASFNIHA